jgi:hypothetical protein
VATSALVSGDDGPWAQGLDGVEGGDPLAPALGAGLTKVLMDVVVDGVSRDHEADLRHVQAGRRVGIGVPEFHRDQVMSLQLDRVIGKRVGEDEIVRKLAGEEPVQQGENLRRRALPHLLDHRGQGERSRLGKALEDHAQAEPVIAVAVGDVDRRQILAMSGNPVGEVTRLVGGQQRVYEDGILLAGDERRRYRRPQPLLSAGRRVVAGGRLECRHVHIPGEWGRLGCHRISLSVKVPHVKRGVQLVIQKKVPP